MISTEELERRLERARDHREEEPAFFRSLLKATVYAHAPVSDDHPRLRLILFQHPDGFMALPFFTSETKAAFAAQSAARIIELTGRQLFELTRGATLMLNPNDGGRVLYPEEVEALLTRGAVARIDTVQLEEERSVLMDVPQAPPAWLIPTLAKVYAALPMVQAAYLIEVRAPEHPDQVTLWVVVAVEPAHAERAARASITALQSLCAASSLALDLTAFDPAQGVPEYLCKLEAAPFYLRPSGDAG